MTIPVENQEIPQTGLEDTKNNTGYSRSASKVADGSYGGGPLRSRWVTGLGLEYDAKEKELQGVWDELQHNDCYFNFQFYTSNINPESSLLKEGITNKPFAGIKGLPRGQRVFLRVRMIRNTWLGHWTEPVEKRVP